MSTNEVSFAGLTVRLPLGWVDVTDDLPDGSPYTLARGDGVGALQFSTARYRADARPEIRAEDLRDLLEEFAEARSLGEPNVSLSTSNTVQIAVSDFSVQGDFIRAWYVSNGSDIVLVTYVADSGEGAALANELSEAASIVASIEF